MRGGFDFAGVGGENAGLGARRLPSWLVPFPVLAFVALILVLAPSQAAAAHRYSGWVEGTASGPGHDFMVGDGLNVVFVDRKHKHTHYTACWHRQEKGDSHKHCWHRRTDARHKPDRIFTDAPSNPGRWVVHWRVHHRHVATWHFRNHIGD